MTVRTSVKAGIHEPQHAQTAVVVKTSVKAGGCPIPSNHAQAAVKVRTGVKAGGGSYWLG